MPFFLLRIQAISSDTIQISSDKISEHSGYQNFPPDVIQNVIGYRKVKFWLPPADPGTLEESMPCPFFFFLDFSSKKFTRSSKKVKILHCRTFTGLKQAQFYAKTFTNRPRKEA
jgi:hypothetical protein